MRTTSVIARGLLLLGLAASIAEGQGLTQPLTENPEGAPALFGHAIAACDDMVAIAAPAEGVLGFARRGTVHVFRQDGTRWPRLTTIRQPGDASPTSFITSIAISPRWLLLGLPEAIQDPNNGNIIQGAVYAYESINGSWTFHSRLTAPDGFLGDRAGFGCSVAVSGDACLIGSGNRTVNGSNNQGKAYFFRFTSGLWQPDSAFTTNEGRNIGSVVQLQANVAFVGADSTRVGDLEDAGAVYVLKHHESGWNMHQRLTAPLPSSGSAFGYSISPSDSAVAIGAIYTSVNGQSQAGAVHVFREADSYWQHESTVTAPQPGAGEFFGRAVSLSSDTLVIGAYNRSVEGLPERGEAFVFRHASGTWTCAAELTDPAGREHDRFGYSVIAVDRQVLVGAPMADVNATANQGKVLAFLAMGDCNGDNLLDHQQLVTGAMPDQDENGQIDAAVILAQPREQSPAADQAFSFSVLAAPVPGCVEPLSYQWQRRNPTVANENSPTAWIDLIDDGAFSNSRTRSLTIDHPIPALATGFRCRIMSSCGCDPATYSHVVNFSVACPADFNADGGVDFQDVEAFFMRWENGC